ncbi:MAG: membrane protein insertion efficiency factor YidD [Proteobacteria bacterium]|nr:membrane protein insertion efficiency factor YidD [Pseudomonadota bacterium]
MKKIAAFPIRLYRILISPLLPPSCRFHPTCSAYALQALERHGVFRGTLLAAGRLLRCHPWRGCGGRDPVPPRFTWRVLARINAGDE